MMLRIMRCELSIKKIFCIAHCLRDEGGQTLAEILIAIGLGMIVLTAMSIAVITGLNNANLSKNQNLATEYAQEGMEVVKQLQLTDYSTFQTLSGRYCLAQSCSTLDSSNGSCWVNTGGSSVNCPPNLNNNFFIRQVDISQNTAACPSTIQATVSVLWNDSKCSSGLYCHSEQLVSCFTNPNPITAP